VSLIQILLLGAGLLGTTLSGYMLYNLWFAVSPERTKDLHANRGGSRVFKGKVYSSFGADRDSQVIAGFKLKKNKSTGKISFEPNGTFSDHAVMRTLDK